MKKLFAILLSAALLLSLAACGGSGSSSPASTPAADAGNNAGNDAGNDAGGDAGPVYEDLSGDLVLYSSMTDSDLDALLTCFGEAYPNINVEVVNGSAGELTSRIAAEASNPQADLVWGGMMDSDGRAHEDIFEDWVSEHDSEAIEGYSTSNGLYSMDHLSTVVFCVNTELEAELGLNITTYEDLLDPALKGKVVLSNPNDSSAAWNNLANIMSVFGTDSDEAWAYIEKLMPNLVIAGSSSACFNAVQQGEYVVGLTYEDGAVILLKNGAENLRLQYPENGTSAAAVGTALVKNGPNPENAKAMINFVCSAEGQTAMAAYQQGTLRYTNAGYTVPDGAWLPATSDIKWVHRDVEYLTEHKPAILERWNDLLATVTGGGGGDAT